MRLVVQNIDRFTDLQKNESFVKYTILSKNVYSKAIISKKAKQTFEFFSAIIYCMPLKVLLTFRCMLFFTSTFAHKGLNSPLIFDIKGI